MKCERIWILDSKKRIPILRVFQLYVLTSVAHNTDIDKP